MAFTAWAVRCLAQTGLARTAAAQTPALDCQTAVHAPQRDTIGTMQTAKNGSFKTDRNVRARIIRQTVRLSVAGLAQLRRQATSSRRTLARDLLVALVRVQTARSTRWVTTTTTVAAWLALVARQGAAIVVVDHGPEISPETKWFVVMATMSSQKMLAWASGEALVRVLRMVRPTRWVCTWVRIMERIAGPWLARVEQLGRARDSMGHGVATRWNAMSPGSVLCKGHFVLDAVGIGMHIHFRDNLLLRELGHLRKHNLLLATAGPVNARPSFQ